MARPSNRSRFEQLIDHFEPRLHNAFLEAVNGIRDRAVIARLVERLERGDVMGAVEAVNIDPEAFGALDLAIAEAFNAGGMDAAEHLALRDPDGHRLVFRWDVRNLVAEAWLREHSSQLVTRITEDQRQAVRQALTTGLEEGRNPRSVALDVVGRQNRATGSRTGGIIGVTSQQERLIASARHELASGETDALRRYLGRQRRDKRFDRTVEKAIREGRALEKATVDRMVGRYADRLLALRGEMLAQTETLGALNGSRNEAIRQAIVSGKVDAETVTKVWRSAADDRVRHSHRRLNGQSVGFYEPFTSPTGARLMYPGDPAAPAHEHVGCRCTMEIKIDYVASLIRRRAA
jgi:hypothetical protein